MELYHKRYGKKVAEGMYATNCEGGNYSGNLNHTGVGSTPRNNIYDMGGNVGEWTTEVCSHQDYPCTVRGGYYYGTASDLPVGVRFNRSQTNTDDGVGFRSTLFVGLQAEEVVATQKEVVYKNDIEQNDEAVILRIVNT